MYKSLHFIITLAFLISMGYQGITQNNYSSSNCDGCQVYDEEQLQQMRDAHEPHIGKSNLRIPDNFNGSNDHTNAIMSELSNKGTDFWLLFMKNYDNVGTSLFLDITSDVNTSGTITIDGIGFSQNYTVTANTITRVTIPTTSIINNSGVVEYLGINVVADDPVTVYGTNQIQFTTDSFLGLPVSILGTQYLTMNYFGPGTSNNNSSQFAIVSPYDNNTVTITPSENTWDGNSAGVPFNVTLNQGETYLVRGAATTNDDLTGSIVESSLPVALFSGSACANVPSGFGYCDHLVQQIPPLSTWGETFVTRPLEGRNLGDTWRFLSAQNNTELSINGVNVATLGFGDYYETVLTESSYIEATNPILSVQFSNGNTWDGGSYQGDPFMMIIPPFQQFLEGYTFSTPGSGFIDNYFTSTVENNGVASMTLDGAPLNPANYAAIPSTAFSAAAFPIDINTTYNLSNPGGYPSGLYVYGFNADDSFGYPGGLSLVNINVGSGPVIELTSATLDLNCVSNLSTADLEISALITDDEEPDVASATLFYRTIGEETYSSELMTEGADDIWSATVSETATEFPGIEFYISATDGQVTTTSPSSNPINSPYSIGIDNNPPQIDHTPVIISEPGVDILISADVTDNTDFVESVNLFYRVPGGTPFYTMMVMNNVMDDTYEATIPGSEMTQQGLEYYIKATDNYGASCSYGLVDAPLVIEPGTTENIPPVPVGFPNEVPVVEVGETYTIQVSFESPEDGQTTDVVVNDGGLPGFSYMVTPGNTALIDIELIGQNDNLGTHTIEFIATDDGSPVESTTVDFQITVVDPLAGQIICIPEGWSMISSYNDPADPDMESIFASLAAEDKVEFVISNEGIYWPSQNINLFESGWNVKKGYKIKMNEEGCLGIVGEMPEDKSFTAEAGISYIPVLCPDPVPAIDIFAQLGEDLLYAFDIYDQLVYWPEGGIYTLQTLVPGKGYLVNMTQEGQAVYNCSKSVDKIVNKKPLQNNSAPWEIEKTGSAHLISVNSAALANLQNGDYIGVFNQDGKCAGHTQFTGELQNLLLVAYGNDLLANTDNGLAESEKMSFKVYQSASGTEIPVEVIFDQNMPNTSTFEESGQSMILKVSESATTIVESKLEKILLHPNPGNGLINIDIPSFNESIYVEVMNMAGQVIYADVIDDKNGAGYQIDLSSKSNGVFLVKFTSNHETVIRRVIVQ